MTLHGVKKPDNWAEDALHLMDIALDLVNYCSVHMPNAGRHAKGAKAFWDVCEMLAVESTRLKKESTPYATGERYDCTGTC